MRCVVLLSIKSLMALLVDFPNTPVGDTDGCGRKLLNILFVD